MKSKFSDMVLREIEEWEREHGRENAYKWNGRWYTREELH